MTQFQDGDWVKYHDYIDYVQDDERTHYNAVVCGMVPAYVNWCEEAVEGRVCVESPNGHFHVMKGDLERVIAFDMSIQVGDNGCKHEDDE